MEAHHQESLQLFLDRYTSDPEVQAILLGGSISHGYAKPNSDIDVNIVVGPQEFAARKAEGTLAFAIKDICTYEGGYVDCKIVSRELLESVAQKGSDPARYAFAHAKIVYSKIPDLAEVLERIGRFPSDQQATRRDRFAAQLLAWRWYHSEGIAKENRYLQTLGAANLVLFACRLVLNENELLFPYHKWMLRVCADARRKPADFDADLDRLMNHPKQDFVDSFCAKLLAFVRVDEAELDWPNHFLRDSEQTWVDHEAPIGDI